VVVSVDPARADELVGACHDASLECVRIGTATADRRLACGDLLDLDLDAVADAQARVVTGLFDAP
jgi:phosphoribosylformylglycinamidine (FGAM) synthase-like enzyme